MQILIDFCAPRPGDNDGEGALRCAFDAPCQTLVAWLPDQVKPVLDAVQALANQGFWCVGYLRYEAASAFDAAFACHQTQGPLAWFGVFKQALPWPDDAADATDTETESGIQWHSPLSRAQFDADLALIHQAIAAGEFYQVNYTAPLDARFVGQPLELFGRLRRAQPNSYAAFIDSGFEQVLSVSPELFFDWKDSRILTRPMKGTAPRGSNPAADQALAHGLAHSPKERAENVMIVDLLRNDLSRIAQPHSVKVPALFQVQTLPTVLQMVSDVSARTRPGSTLADVFGALFPCGSITGAPKVRAMQMIRRLEPEPRGIYCGAIGLLRPGGHATFNVAIRTIMLQGQRATCGIGSGITADATAAGEWQEWQHKRGFLERASQPFKLLETLRLQDGELHHLEAHLARLARAAAHFSYPFDEARIRRSLQALTDGVRATAKPPANPASPDRHLDGPDGPASDAVQPAAQDTGQAAWRVRLQLDATGTPTAEVFMLNSTPALVTLALAAMPFEAAQSEFTRFKTTRRGHYEAFAPTDPALFDTLLYNPRGELTECTRGNIALLQDGQWLTPALHCGLLAGVGRAHCLQTGRLREAVMTLADLRQAQALAFVNSLRGWVAARLVLPKPDELEADKM